MEIYRTWLPVIGGLCSPGPIMLKPIAILPMLRNIMVESRMCNRYWTWMISRICHKATECIWAFALGKVHEDTSDCESSFKFLHAGI